MALTCKAFGDIITFTRASTATFTGSNGLIQSATTNTPRFDYDPVTLAAKGLLIEEQRTNLLTFSDGTVAQLGLSSNVSNAASPISASFTNSIQFIDNTALRFAYKQTTTVASTVYTVSVFVRMDDDSVPIVGTTTLVGDFGVSFEGVFLTTPSTVTSVGGNVYRISAAITAAGGAAQNFGVVKYTTQSAKGFRVTGYQLEAGAFATSYIPTVASQVTRSADVASVNTLSPWYNATEGTLYVEQTYDVVANYVSVPSLYDSAFPNNSHISIYNNSPTGLTGTIRVNAGAPNAVTKTTTVVGSHKMAIAYKANDSAFTIDGLTASAISNPSVPSVTTLGVAGLLVPYTQAGQAVAHLRRITYYPRRLSNAELQAITA